MRDNKDNRIREEVERVGRPTIEMLDREIARQGRKESYGRLIRGILVVLTAAVAVIVIVTNLWICVLQVDGSSMNPLLQMNEIVFSVRTDNPARNDVIAFYHNNTLYIKRVIALSGDTVNIDADGFVSVNGQLLDEPYVAEHSRGELDIDLPYTVPPETVFVMGDNREVALDSRLSEFGPVSREQIIGKVIFRLWPLSRIGAL